MRIRFQMWLDEDLKNLARKMAERRGWSIAKIIEMGLTELLKKHNYIKNDEPSKE